MNFFCLCTRFRANCSPRAKLRANDLADNAMAMIYEEKLHIHGNVHLQTKSDTLWVFIFATLYSTYISHIFPMTESGRSHFFGSKLDYRRK